MEPEAVLAEDPGRVTPEAMARGPHRGRDLAAMAVLGTALAMLWAIVFLVTANPWGEYRPPQIQEPPPPPAIMVPALTLEQAREVVERSAKGSHPHEQE